MNESVSKYQVREDETIILDNRNEAKFLSQLKDGEVYYKILQKGSKLRTYLQHRYLFGGVYSEFVSNGNFNTVDEAHEYFTEHFLKRTDVFEENETAYMQKCLSKARKIISNQMYHSYCGSEVKSKLKVVWVQSTTSLTTKEFNNYIEAIKIFGADLGIHIKDPDQYFEQ